MARILVGMTNENFLTVGVDGSTTSDIALGWAAREADRRGSRLVVVHACSVPTFAGEFGAGLVYPLVDLDALREEDEVAVDRQIETIRTAYPMLAIDKVVEIGGAVSTLVDTARDGELSVVGSRGAGSVAAMFLGSIAHGVAHRSTCPAVLVPECDLQPAIGRIVVGTDGSPAAAAAVRWAQREAVLWDAELVLAHVWEYPYPVDVQRSVGTAELMERDAQELLANAATGTDAQIRVPDKLQVRLMRGAPAPALIDEAAGADLLVVGARGRGAIRSALLGSTSSYAIHHARCPVVIVHPGP